jgi:predicted nuclease of predicted toxin-antitoxin system
VRLLLDENLSPRLSQRLAVAFPDSLHVDDAGLHGKTDAEIWKYAGQNAFILVSKDNDFRQLSFLHGAPPKVIWLHIGNAPTRNVEALILARRDRIRDFVNDAESTLLIIEP